MKKLIIFSLLAVSLSFASCEPIDDRDEMIGNITADQIDAVVTVEQVNGKNVNKVKFSCSSPINCQWSDGVNTVAAASGELTMLLTGSQTITLTGINGDGTIITKEFPVTIDELYYEVDPTYGLLFGTGTKVWTWADERCYGNGGFRNDVAGPEWWVLSPSDIDGQSQYPNQGSGATMTFDLNGSKITLSSGQVGKVTFDTGKKRYDNWYGTLNSTVGVLAGGDQNGAQGPQFSTIKTYNIMSLTENEMKLAWSEDAKEADWSTGWFWVFKAK